MSMSRNLSSRNRRPTSHEQESCSDDDSAESGVNHLPISNQIKSLAGIETPQSFKPDEKSQGSNLKRSSGKSNISSNSFNFRERNTGTSVKNKSESPSLSNLMVPTALFEENKVKNDKNTNSDLLKVSLPEKPPTGKTKSIYNFCNGCNGHYNELFKMPCCQTHELCEKCIKNGPDYNNCDDCRIFFISITNVNEQVTQVCRFCKKESLNIKFKCEVHKYCKKCLSFMTENCFSTIYNDCDDCRVCFKGLKSEVSSPESFEKNVGGIDDEPSHQDIKSNKIIDEKTCTNQSCEFEKGDLLNLPTCIDHKYCANCIKNEFKIVDCKKCSKYLTTTEHESNIFPYLCSLCSDLPLTHDSNCKLHAYCTECSEFLLSNDFSHVLIANKCSSCRFYFNELKRIKVKSSDENKESSFKPSPIPDAVSEEDKLKIGCRLDDDAKFQNIEPNQSPEVKICSNSSCKNQIGKLFRTSKCCEHEFCENCIGDEKTLISCNKCENYFKCISSNHFLTNSLCRLCEGYLSNQSFNCDAHEYCQVCYEFLVKNDFAHIKYVSECKKCCTHFESIKFKEQKKVSESSNLGENDELNSIKNSVGEVIDGNKSENIESKPKSDLKKCSSKDCETFSESLIKGPRCSEHEFCEKCIKKRQEYNYCSKCYYYFKSLEGKSDFSSNLCSLCHEGKLIPDYKCKLHGYCEICFEFILKNGFNHIEFVSTCYDCKSFFSKAKSQDEISPKEISEATPQLKLESPGHNQKGEIDANSPKNKNILDIKENKPSLNLKNCKICGEAKEKLFKTSKCIEHEYCIDCVKEEKNIKFCYECSKCYKYFSCLKQRNKASKDNCYLCDSIDLSSKVECSSHIYCKVCYAYLVENDFNHILNAYGCNLCRMYFEKVKSTEKKYLEGDSIVNSQVLNYPTSSSEKVETDISNRNTKAQIISNLKKCSYEYCKTQFEKLYKTPKCIDHGYCKNCIKTENNYYYYYCGNCYDYFVSLRRSNYTSSFRCYLCTDYDDSEKVRGCELHKFCKICYSFALNNDDDNNIIVIKCNECFLNFKRLKTQQNKTSEKTNAIDESINKKLDEQSKNIEPVSDSNPTSVNISSKLSICSVCNAETSKLFKTPRCKMHEFCADCIILKNPMKNCESCTMYFEITSLKDYQSKFYCCLCKNFSNYPYIKCNLHSYCQHCTEFLENNDYTHIKIVSDCEECRKYFTIIKGKKTSNQISIEDKEPAEIGESESNKRLRYIYGNKWDFSSSSCSGCYNHRGVEFKTPRCIKHTYCRDCIKTEPKYSRSISCEFCSMYFESLKIVHDSNVYKCSLCKLTPFKSDIKCKSHSYCTYCYDYITKNDYSHLINVANCQECCASLKLKKENNTSGPDSKESKEKLSNNFSSKISSEIPIANAHFQGNNTSDEAKPYSSNTTNSNFTRVELNNSKSNNFEHQYPKPQIPNPDSGRRLHYEPSSHVSKDPETIYIDSCDLIKCSCCSEKLNVKGFLCNHNLCIFCLVKICCHQMQNFFYCIQNDPNYVKKFNYFCLLNSCNKKISVPTKMILVNLQKFLNDPVKSQELAGYSYMVAPGSMDQWISYFDGLAFD